MAGRFFIFPICARGAIERDIAIEWLNYSKTSASDLLAKIFNYRHCEFGWYLFKLPFCCNTRNNCQWRRHVGPYIYPKPIKEKRCKVLD